MEYNTTKSKLINGEYGRHVQKMIEYAMEIKDKNLRTQQANAIVRAMSLLCTGTKDTEDYWHKLWDHLFIMSDYQLDIDAPFPMPARETTKRVASLKYPKHNIRFRPYGYLIENIINKVKTEEDSPEKEQTVVNVANHLKKQYLNWNRDSVNDELIAEHLQELSGGKLELKENFRFSSTQAILNDIEKSTNTNAGTNKNGKANHNANGNGNPNGKNKKRKKKNNINRGQPLANKNKQYKNQPNKQ
ncbi:MAG: DUF4290 domain-containing protein [Lentimicrobiaceae bacterium]|nr:DUF4290 domain-containing protein [Lentimicrobiaceae bacterium]